LEKLAQIFGPLLAVVLIISALGSGVSIVYLLLKGVEGPVRALLPSLMRYALKALEDERKTEDPAIRLEYRSHACLFVLAFLCVVAYIGTAVIPWGDKAAPRLLSGAISCIALFLALIPASLGLSRRRRLP
jgi:hypothetical protein